MSGDNCYLEQIRRVLPRLLALYDTSPISRTYGQGDRFRWAWKLIDFANGTYQGASHGLARLLVSDLLPQELSKAAIMRRIEAMFHGAEVLRRPNGSLEEAFPFESSFCVTALLAFDLLSTIELLDERMSTTQRARCLDVIRPMIRFLHRADERHAFISNHLAVAAAALLKWHALTGERGEERGRALLARVLDRQSSEGWFVEYGGADPGYQSLCTQFLAEIHRMCPDLNLLPPLRRSIEFLRHFVHPDGSFGGLYGSRNTRLYWPAGFETLAPELPEAAAVALRMRQSIASGCTPTLEVMDEPNLVPMFNAYCAAATCGSVTSEAAAREPLPSASTKPWRRQYPEAGIIIDNGPSHYSIISWKKGGVCYHFIKDGGGQGQLCRVDGGRVVASRGGTLYTTQALGEGRVQANGDRLTIHAPLVAVRNRLPGPWSMVLLRLLNVTVMRSITIGNMVKSALARMLITGKKVAPVSNRRAIKLGPDLTIADELVGDTGRFRPVADVPEFTAIHMASCGYWQVQDDRA